eukprot:evm.model.scf_314EXC.7 EVM.evm.TU.scf_314EXC.7   scf_314EXC:33482-35656(-)
MKSVQVQPKKDIVRGWQGLLQSTLQQVGSSPDYTLTRAAVAKAVKEWQADASAPTKVVLPLDHHYNPGSLSFKGLEGKDRVVVDVLRGIEQAGRPLVDLHLAMVTISVKGGADDWSHYSYGSSWYRRPLWGESEDSEGPDHEFGGSDYSEEADHHWEGVGNPEESVCENATTSNACNMDMDAGSEWVTTDDSRVDLGLSIDCESELLKVGDFSVGHDKVDGVNGRCRRYMTEYGPTRNHRAVVVLWPHCNAFKIVSSAGTLPALRMAHRMLKEGEADALEMLDRVMEFMTQRWGTIHRMDEGRVCALAATVVTLAGPRAESLSIDLLSTLACPVKVNLRPLHLSRLPLATLSSLDQQQRPAPTSVHVVGIPSNTAAVALANMVQVISTEAVSDALCKLLAACPRAQMLNCTALAQTMAAQEPISAHTAAVADAVSSMVLKENLAELSIEEVLAVFTMHFTIDSGNSSARSRSLLSKHTELTLLQLSKVVSHCLSFKSDITRRPELEKHAADLVKTFLDASWKSVSMAEVCNVVEAISWAQGVVDGEYLLGCFADAVLGKIKTGEVSEQMFSSLLEQPCMRAEASSDSVHRLIVHRLHQLKQYAFDPKFSWCQPLAEFHSDYPQVQAFLWGPEQCFTISGVFKDIQHAQHFANKYFGCHQLDHNYSAVARTNGVGCKAQCLLRKTKAAYHNLVRVFKQRRKEAAELQSLAADAGGIRKRQRVEIG